MQAPVGHDGGHVGNADNDNVGNGNVGNVGNGNDAYGDNHYGTPFLWCLLGLHKSNNMIH